nr:hypothetical protein [Streptomyces sp.]
MKDCRWSPHDAAACPGCGLVGEGDASGPVHAYMSTEAVCWGLFCRLLAELGPEATRLATDAYAAQHPLGGEDDRRQRQSVAVHLMALCLHVENRVREERLRRMMTSLSRSVLPRLKMPEWPALAPPSDLGQITVRDVDRAAPEERHQVIEEWAWSVWAAWAEQHDTVRGWAALALSADRR